ncbi:unnamed protein product [Larinioides sclopetarius]|uniref:Transmembrane protein n=1 Tax=Larinioides sclopetarius TaxID=280406 RepID=A0AAV1YZU9_9ARAC
MGATNLFEMFFIPSMGGLNLGFSDQERELAETVHSIALTEINRHLKASEIDPDFGKGDDDAIYSERIELSRKNLNRIFELLAKARDARQEFLENYPDWCVLRKEAIQKLTEIEQTIQTEKFWCNVGKMAGHVIGGAGAVALVGAFFFPPAAPAAILPACLSGIAPFVPSFLLPAAPAIVSPLVVNGGIAAGVGGFSSLGTKATEVILLRQRMEAAKKVLQGDKRAFAYMENWFKHTKELIDAVEDVIGFDVIKQLHEDIDALFVGIKRLNDLKNRTPGWLKAAVKFCVRQMLTGKLFAKCLGSGLIAVIVTFMFVVVLLSRRNRFLFKCVVKTKELMNMFYIDIDAVSELARVFAAVTVAGASAIEYIPVEAAKQVSLGVFAGLGFAISAANIVLTSIDIKNGSTCKQREEVKKAVEKLQEELDLLQQIYDAVGTTEVLSKQNSLTSEIQDSEEVSHTTHEKFQEELGLCEEFYESEDIMQNLTLFNET